MGLSGNDSGFIGPDAGVQTGVGLAHVRDQQIARVQDLDPAGQFDTLWFCWKGARSGCKQRVSRTGWSMKRNAAVSGVVHKGLTFKVVCTYRWRPRWCSASERPRLGSASWRPFRPGRFGSSDSSPELGRMLSGRVTVSCVVTLVMFVTLVCGDVRLVSML